MQAAGITEWAKRLSSYTVGIALRGRRYHCPMCDRRYSSFLPMYGVFPSYNAVCPGCSSLERHRSLWLCLLHLRDRVGIKLQGRMLHVAPEPSLAAKFKQTFDYLSVDLDGSKAMRAADITNLNFPDDHFDAVVCNHVLEHIPDDRRAISELFRVLRPGGWASLLVPRIDGRTDEDPAVTDPEERARRFGQSDHVRIYGDDYFERLRLAGFDVEVYRWKDFLTPGQERTFVLPIDEEMIFGWKPETMKNRLANLA